MREEAVYRGMVVKRLPFKESSLLCFIFTDLSGYASFIVQGAKRANSKFSGIFEPFNQVKISAYPKRESSLITVINAELLRPYQIDSFLLHTWKSLALEVCTQLFGEEADSRDAYELLISYFDYLTPPRKNIPALFLRFLFRICAVLGIAVFGQVCSVCQKTSVAGYSFSGHGFVCENCSPQYLPVSYLSAEAREILKILPAIGNCEKEFSAKAVLEITEMLLEHLSGHFNHQIKLNSLKILEQYGH